MPRHYFTDEQIKELKKSPYVDHVSDANVFFTEDFKKEFMRLYRSGIGPGEIFRRCEIDPKILGNSRVKGIACRLRTQAVRPEGFLRKKNSSKGRPRKKKLPEFSNDSERADYYKEYAERLEQELDLLKKIEALEEADSLSRARNTK